MTTTTEAKEECGACGRSFDTLDEVFTHPCDAININTYSHPLLPGDNIDAPERNGGGKGGSQPSRSNRYPGNCIKCGGRVEAEAGLLIKDNSKQRSGTVWGVEHKRGECVENATPVKTGGISPAQEKYVRDLLAERNPDADADEVVRVINELPNPKAGASAMIDALKALPMARTGKVDASVRQPVVLNKGDVHVVDGDYYRVHMAQGSGNLYACKWSGSSFDYERGAISKLDESNKITAEQAAEFGHMFERCCFCSLAIDTPESTEVGYGPICARKHGLPWGVK